MELVLGVIKNIFDINTLLSMIIGCNAGIIIGAIPGLNGGIGCAILIPFTFAMAPLNGLLLLGGIYMGSTYGGSISGILINVPGTAEAYCTSLEGYPLAKNGRGKEALYLAVLSSVFGGLIGILALIFFTPMLSSLSLKFGPPEMFLVTITGLTVVGSLTGKNIFKGFFAAAFGVFLSMIGIDHISGAYRFTLGIPIMAMGINLLAVVLGLFAISEMLVQIRNISKKRKHSGSNESCIKISDLGNINIKVVTVLRNIFSKPLLIIKSSILGTVIGILPGAGTVIAAFIAYGEAKRTSKGEKFGVGNIKGIIASESANNAAVGGALVPMLSLGIPGSVTSAIMYGAMIIHGLSAGPRLFLDHALFAYSFVYGMLVIVAIMGLTGILFVPLFSIILKIDFKYLIPTVIMLSLIGAYSIRNSIYDVIVTIVFGFLGLLFDEFEIPKPPIILGLILSNLIEKNFRLSMIIAKATNTPVMQYIITRPLSIIIILLSIFLVYVNFKAISIDFKNNK